MGDRLYEFPVNFANAAVKLRRAVDAGEGVTFDAGEAQALLDAFKALRGGGGQEGDADG